MPDSQHVLLAMQMALNFGNLCIMLYAFKKFLAKPQDTLMDRVKNVEIKVSELEVKMQENLRVVDRSLKLGNEEFRSIKEGNKVLQSCMLALVDFELSYCSRTDYDEDTEDLEKAKKTLHDYLARK